MVAKYVSVFKISLQQEFAYRLSFVMWRFRNVLGIFLLFYLWDSVFAAGHESAFGYNRDKILTYVFGVLVLRALIMSARAVDISGEISRGDIMNYLVRPLDYFKYWFTRDLASKALNITFAIGETLILFVILKPPFFVQNNPVVILLFLFSIIASVVLYFYLLLLVNMITFWVPEAGWAGQYLFIGIFTTFLSGSVFPLDILPQGVQKIIYLLPFPYLIFFPLQVYLGNLSSAALIGGLFSSVVWVVILGILARVIWTKGIRQYVTYGG